MVIEGHPRVLLPASGLLPYEIKVGAEPDRDLKEIEATTPRICPRMMFAAPALLSGYSEGPTGTPSSRCEIHVTSTIDVLKGSLPGWCWRADADVW
jgi:hypothetical protein